MITPTLSLYRVFPKKSGLALLLILILLGLSTISTAETSSGALTTQADPVELSQQIKLSEPRPVAPNLNLKEVALAPSPVEVKEVELEKTTTENTELTQSESASTQSQLPAQATTKLAITEQTITELPSETTEKLILLGTEIPPGTATRLAWSPGNAISGLSLPTPVLVVNGRKPGDTLCLTGAIHGDELNGIEIVRRVIYDLDPEKLSGTVIGIPIVNLQGFQNGSRYLSDRRDLNRHFPGDPAGSLASRIAYSLFDEVVNHCDLLVDLHTGSLRRTNLVQVRADMRYSQVIKFTQGFDKTVVVHSPGTEGMLRHAAVARGIIAVTMEVGESMRLQEDQVKRGANSVNSLLHRLNMYSRFFTWGKPEPIYYKSNWMRAPRGGILFSNIPLGASIAPGDVLGTVTDPITNESTDIISTIKGRIIGMAVNQVVMPGFAAYHVGVEASEDSLYTPQDFLAKIRLPIAKIDNRDLVSED